MLFPLNARPSLAYNTGGRRYGANRSNGTRKHAGCDLIAPIGTPIRAVEDGTVQAFYFFYHDTYALEVDHGEFTVRYGEVTRRLPAGIRVGARVMRGQHIANVGRLSGGSHMLHFEMYDNSASGPLTVRRNPPFQRRSDLIDPTPYLDAARIDAGDQASAVLPQFITPWSFTRMCFPP
jgi:murein DD-endopeptidase MepM/ murein hydrolase activator NlpD